MEQQRRGLESDCLIPCSKITALINRITKMSKNPSAESDLSQVLDEFLQKLGECDKYLENGIFNMNFAEAALLLQSSADLYSKKVDLLWDIIFDYQKRMLLAEQQSATKDQEIERLEERKRKYKRKRKTNADETQTAKLVNNFSFGSADNCDYLNQNLETLDLSKEWDKFYTNKDSASGESHASKNSLFLPDNSVRTEENDYVGKYNQFHSASLIEDIFHLENQKLIADDYNCVTKMRIDCYVIHDFLLEKSTPNSKPQESYAGELNDYIKHFMETHGVSEKSLQLPNQTLEQICCKKSYVSLERLSFDAMKEQLRRTSLADSLFDEDQMSLVSGTCQSPCHSIYNENPKDCAANGSFDKMSGAAENRSKSCSQDSAFYEDNDDCEMDSPEGKEETTAANTNMTVTDVNVTPESDLNCENISEARDNSVSVVDISVVGGNSDTDVITQKVDSKIEKTEKTREVTTSQITNTQLCTGSSVMITRGKVPRKFSAILKELKKEKDTSKKRKVVKPRISEKMLRKLATGISVGYRNFENFCRSEYKPASGEGAVPPQLSDSEDSDDEDSCMSDEDFNRVTPVFEQISDSEVEDDEGVDQSVNDKQDPPEEPEVSTLSTSDLSRLPDVLHSSISPIPMPGCSTSADLDILGRTSTPRQPQIPRPQADLEQEEILRQNVRDWRSFILPKLQTMENRSDFDIHEYGSQIIEPSFIGERRQFKDVVKGKGAGEVARYFIATLQLANTYNVEIDGADPGKIANDSFVIKTLDKTKHHELLEDYQAPSEETFKERLERVKALNPTIAFHSTAINQPPAKKIKFTKSRKSLF